MDEGVTYTVKRSASRNGYYRVLARGLKEKKFVDLTAANNEDYFYVVSAENEVGESLNSQQAMAKPRRGKK